MSRSWKRSRLSTAVLLLCAVATSGCCYLRVPRIDPTGERIFAEGPISSTPRFEDRPGRQTPADAVAVTLSAQDIVAQVGTEVVLLAGVRGGDNYLRTNQRLEWSLAPGSAGHFVDVGRNGPVDWLVGDFNRPRKIDNTLAIGSTSRKYLRLNRGTETTIDDVCVLSGQGWITLTSPVEGTSHVTVYAPGVYSWDARTRAATVHWIDAQPRFPPPAINPAGTAHVFTTSVVRRSDCSPCAGWQVRYTIVDGPPAGFAPDGAPSIVVTTDAAGQASAEIRQDAPKPGTNKIAIEVVRPASLGGPGGKRLVAANGSTLKTWTSPDLALSTTGPAVAGVGATLSYLIEVSNPGDLPAEDVVVVDELPAGLAYVDSNPAAELSGARLQWRLGQLGAGENRRLQVNCRTTQLGSVAHCADATAAGGLKASDCATTTVMAAQLEVKITGPVKATVGSQVTFNVQITNRSQVPARELEIADRFDDGLVHAEATGAIIADLQDLAPGQSRQISMTFRVAKAGRQCHTVEVTGADGVRASAEGCVTGVEGFPGTGGAAGAAVTPQPRPQPTGPASVSVKKTGPAEATVGKEVRFEIDVTNTGGRTLTNVKVVDVYAPSIEPRQGTTGYRFEDDKTLVYTIDSLAPGKTEQLEVVCKCLAPDQLAVNRITVTTAEGATARGEASLTILAAEVPGSGLTLTVTDLTDPVRKGRGLTYEILVSNDGQTVQTNVTVEATVPNGMIADPIITAGPTDREILGQTVTFSPAAEIRPGEKLSYRVGVRTLKAGEYVFEARLTGDNLPQPVSARTTTTVW